MGACKDKIKQKASAKECGKINQTLEGILTVLEAADYIYIWYSFFHNYLVASCLFTIYKNQGVPWDNRNNLSSLHMVPSQHSQGIPKYLHLYFPNGAISGPGHLNWPMLFVQDQDSWAAGNGWTFKLRFMAMLKSVCTVQDITDVFFSSLDNLLKGSCV